MLPIFFIFFRSEADLLDEALGYIYYYNNLREHSSPNFQTPFFYLKAQLPEVEDGIRYVIPIILDKAVVKLGPRSGYHVLAQHQKVTSIDFRVSTPPCGYVLWI